MSAPSLALALAVDGAIRLPDAAHPVAWMGRSLDRLAGEPSSRPGRDLAHGLLAVTAVTVASAGIGAVVERGARRMATLRIAEVLLLASAFAIRGLLEAGERPLAALEHADLDAAREELRALVSRPRADLDEAHVCSAVIESLAENLADSVVGPMLAYVVAGLPGALAYRVINTADAMLGYRDEREWLGKAAARLDDLVNLAPSRITAGLLVATAPIIGLAPRQVLRGAWRNAPRTASPNAGWPMAAAAGGLGVWLEKEGSYRLGDGDAPDVASARLAKRWVMATAWLAAAAAVALAAWKR